YSDFPPPASCLVATVNQLRKKSIEEWSGDGHDKLTGIGFPIWAVRDVWSGKWLGIWLVPNNRLKDTIAYLYLKLVYEYGDMDAQPHFTRAQARAARPEDDDPATRQVTSLHQSILGPPPVLMDGDPASGGPVTNLPATPPPTFVQPAWILPRPHGEDTVRAREAIRASRSHTQFSNPADSPSQLNIPVDPPSRASPAAFGSPMAQDPANLDDDDKWFGVDASDLYKLYNVYATSGKEGSGHHTYSRPRSAFSSPGDDNVHCVPPPVELSPSVVLEDFVELPPHTASSVPASRHLHAPSRGPFRDPASAPVPNFLQNGRGQQPAPTIHLPSGAMLMVPPGDLILGPALVNPLLARTLEHISDAPLAPSLWSLTMPRLDLTAPPSG
ncbi:MAG: hypothetical protein NXY57DRAFT_1043769, partial [Lentinula lateritia]